jgi:hypothetical protein
LQKVKGRKQDLHSEERRADRKQANNIRYVAAGQGRWKKCKAKPEDDENQEGTDGVAESAY